jgi:hypothetical protein
MANNDGSNASLFYGAQAEQTVPHQNTREMDGAAAVLLIPHEKRNTHNQAAAINTAASSFQMDESKGGRIQMERGAA